MACLEFEMPDKHHLKFMEESIIDILIERMKHDVESTVIQILKALTRLATKSNYFQLLKCIMIEECKARILVCGGLGLALSLVNDKSDELKFELYKLIYNLN